MRLHNRTALQLGLLAFLQRIRFSRGLLWRRHYPDIAPALRGFARGCALSAAIVCVYGLVGRLEYQDAVAAEAEARARIAVAQARIADEDLAECLNGRRAWSAEDPRTGKRSFTRCLGSEVIAE